MEHIGCGNAVCDRLLGALIGLARAIVGNEEFVNDVTHMVILEGLCAIGDGNADSQKLEQLTDWAGKEKQRLVPNCFHCAAPCGRTADYDVSLIGAAGQESEHLKRAMLKNICTAAAPALEKLRTGGALGEESDVFYSALFALGEDWPPDYLLPVAESAAALAGTV